MLLSPCFPVSFQNEDNICRKVFKRVYNGRALVIASYCFLLPNESMCACLASGKEYSYLKWRCESARWCIDLPILALCAEGTIACSRRTPDGARFAWLFRRFCGMGSAFECQHACLHSHLKLGLFCKAIHLAGILHKSHKCLLSPPSVDTSIFLFYLFVLLLSFKWA